MGVLSTFFLIIFAITAVLIVILVLLQDEQGEGFGGLFGGGGTTPFNMSSGNILTKTTAVLGTVFIVTSLLVALLFESGRSDNVISESRQTGTSTVDWFSEEPLPADSGTGQEGSPDAEVSTGSAGTGDSGAEAGVNSSESTVQDGSRDVSGGE